MCIRDRDDPYAGLTEDPFADRDYDDELAPRRQQRHTRSGHEQAEESSLPAPVDWAELFATDSSDHLWLVDDLWPDGRQIHIFAKAKTGKRGEFIQALLAVEGFAYKGAVPKAMRYPRRKFKHAERVEPAGESNAAADATAERREEAEPAHAA